MKPGLVYDQGYYPVLVDGDDRVERLPSVFNTAERAIEEARLVIAGRYPKPTRAELLRLARDLFDVMDDDRWDVDELKKRAHRIFLGAEIHPTGEKDD